MTILSVNVNKIALLRNSRGRNYPDLIAFTRKILALGVKGITVHPRQDERHVTRQDVVELTALLQDYPGVEFNIEGYPSDDFLELVERVRPAQCTLVPDAPDQLTSDHGWDVPAHEASLRQVLNRLRKIGVRSCLFLDPNPALVEHVKAVGADRIELYTEAYASAFGGAQQESIVAQYEATATRARALHVGVNAGHDLDLHNLPRFLQIAGISEVSIGHALVVESLEQGLASVIRQYLTICGETLEKPWGASA